MTTKNRRKHLRTRTQNLVAHLRVGDRAVIAPVEDISIGGALLRTTEPIQHSSVLVFDVARPGLKRPLRLMGLVVDVRGGRGVAVRFNGLDKETGDRLVELLRDLGAMVTSPLADAPDPPLHIPPPRAPTSPGILGLGPPTPTATPAPAGGGSGTVPVQPGISPAGDESQRLMVQLRGAIMEIGTLQQQLSQRDRELGDLKEKFARSESDVRKGGTTETLVGKLEMEKQRLEEQLAEARGRSRADTELIKREAENVVTALSRLVDAIKRLG